MPKRKSSRDESDDFYYLEKKLRKLERKVRDSRSTKRKHRRRSRSARKRSRSPSYTRRRRSYTRSRSPSPPAGAGGARSPRTRRRSRSRSRSPHAAPRRSPADIRSELPNHQQPEAENTHEPVSAASAENSQSVSNDVEIVPGSVKEGAPVENTETTELDISILEILGDDPTLIKSFGAEIQKDLAVRLEHCVTNGLSKEIRKELKEKYLIPSNCKLINAPVLNAEIKAAVSDQVAKRDKAIEIKQSQVASAIAALSQALTHVLSSSDKDSELIKILMDTSRLLCDCQHSDSITRRNFILSTLKKDMKDQLQNSKVDNYLFGENFAETIKTAKAITKSGAELKAAPVSKLQSIVKKASTSGPGGPSKNLNWKGPFPTRRQTEAPRTKEPATTRSRPSNSSRPSQQHRAPRNSRR